MTYKKAKPFETLPDSETDPNSEDFVYWEKDILAERESIAKELLSLLDARDKRRATTKRDLLELEDNIRKLAKELKR